MKKWDDGGKKTGDGWYISWDLETGRNWFWGNLISKDICLEIWGDGIMFNTNSTFWDDGNKISGDGCNSTCDIESGWTWSGGSQTSKDICLEIWGDCIRFNIKSMYWDDGYIRWYKPVIIGFLPSLFSNSKRIAARGWLILQSKMWGLQLTFQVDILNYY